MSLRNKKNLKNLKKSKTLKIDTGKITIGPFRSSFMRVLKLTGEDDDNQTCSTAILIPKKDKTTSISIKETIRWVARQKFNDKVDPFKNGAKYAHTRQDGDILYEDDDSSVGKEAKRHWLLGTKAYALPGLVGKDGKKIVDPETRIELFLSGNYFNFVLLFKAYDFKMQEGGQKKGVRCELKHIQFVSQGERLDGSTDPEDEFSALESDEDEDDYDDDD